MKRFLKSTRMSVAPLLVVTLSILSSSAFSSDDAESQQLSKLCQVVGHIPACERLIDLYAGDSNPPIEVEAAKAMLAFLSYEKNGDVTEADNLQAIVVSSPYPEIKRIAASMLGSIYFVREQYDRAAEIAGKQLAEVDPKDLYWIANYLLLKHYANIKLGKDDADDVAAIAANIKASGEPSDDLLMHYFWAVRNAGDGSGDLGVSDDPNDNLFRYVVRGFYFGEKALQDGKKDKARALFSLATSTSMATWTEYLMARAELAKLGGALPQEQAIDELFMQH